MQCQHLDDIIIFTLVTRTTLFVVVTVRSLALKIYLKSLSTVKMLLSANLKRTLNRKEKFLSAELQKKKVYV